MPSVRAKIGSSVAVIATLVVSGCVLAPRATRDERLRAAAAGGAWQRPVSERVLPELPADPGWRDLLQHAFLANGELEAAWHDWRAALDRIDVAAGWPNTNVAVSYEYLFSRDNLKAWDRSTLGVGFDPMQNLSFPTKPMAAGRAALEAARAAGRRFEQMKFDLQRRVLSAWAEWALLGERLRLQRATVDLQRLRADSAGARLTAGGPQQAVLRAEVERGLAEDALRRLEAEAPQRRARLNALLGRPADAPLALPAALPAPRPLPRDDARLLAVAVHDNPELAALGHERESRRHAVARARQEFIPDVNPFASFTGGMEQVAGMMVSLPTRIPIILGAIREARAMLARAEAGLRQTALERGADFVATLTALRDLERQAALVDARLLPAAEHALADARSGYETGTLGVDDLVDAEAVVLELRLLRAEASAMRDTRLAELEALAGVDVETLGAGEPS
jgi:outer membrane protein TolC